MVNYGGYGLPHIPPCRWQKYCRVITQNWSWFLPGEKCHLHCNGLRRMLILKMIGSMIRILCLFWYKNLQIYQNKSKFVCENDICLRNSYNLLFFSSKLSFSTFLHIELSFNKASLRNNLLKIFRRNNYVFIRKTTKKSHIITELITGTHLFL